MALALATTASCSEVRRYMVLSVLGLDLENGFQSGGAAERIGERSPPESFGPNFLEQQIRGGTACIGAQGERTVARLALCSDNTEVNQRIGQFRLHGGFNFIHHH